MESQLVKRGRGGGSMGQGHDLGDEVESGQIQRDSERRWK